jgi:diguanylate cyclase (GGDEF)-like protein
MAQVNGKRRHALAHDLALHAAPARSTSDTTVTDVREVLASTTARFGTVLGELGSPGNGALRGPLAATTPGNSHADSRREHQLERELALLAQVIAQTHHMAFMDPLTGLPNRTLLLDRFNQAVSQGARQQRQVALLFLDLDGFKHVNDTLGHRAGDSILQQVAARLTSCLRSSDTACRYGGDEFVVLLPELDGRDDATVVAEKICIELARPYLAEGRVVRLTTSAGMAVYPRDGKECGDLIHFSDAFMYQHKARKPASPTICDALQSAPASAPASGRNPSHGTQSD